MVMVTLKLRGMTLLVLVKLCVKLHKSSKGDCASCAMPRELIGSSNAVPTPTPAAVSLHGPPTHPPTHLEAQQEVKPADDVLIDAAVQCDLGLDEADDLLLFSHSQVIEAPSVTSRPGSCLQGSPLMVEIGESSVNVADHHEKKFTLPSVSKF